MLKWEIQFFIADLDSQESYIGLTYEVIWFTDSNNRNKKLVKTVEKWGYLVKYQPNHQNKNTTVFT